MILDALKTETKDHIELVRGLVGNSPRKAFAVTFGCQQNEADSEKLLGMAKAMGYTRALSAEEADLILLNTCAIREHAEVKVLSLLGRFKALKKKNPELVIGVCGCMAAQEHIANMLKCDFHYVSFTLEPNMLHRFPEALYRYLTERKRCFILGEDKGDLYEELPVERSSSHRAWVSIMYGCNNFCSYCIVPYVRGRERSRNSADIIRECRELVAAGCREITLLGQNVNSYKSDIDFADLLEKIGQIDGDFIIRFMTSHPKDVSDKLISVMARYTPKIAPYFHLPLQSGSDKILKLMHRTYDRERFISVAEKLRSAVPGISVSTDVIVGFPGEEESDFLDTLDVLGRVRFDMAYAFKYSPRRGTVAASMPDAIPETEKESRLARLLELQDKISYERSLEYVGRTERVLVDCVSKRAGYKTVDARTASNRLVHFEAGEETVGQFRLVKIVKAEPFNLIAEEIK